MSQTVKRACDACHRRKVKCDGINPCRNCSSAQLSCTYNAIPQKKGPKGSRAKVISELRETQRQTSLSAKVQNRITGLTPGPVPNSASAPAAGLLSAELIKECLEFYFSNMYAQMPILSRQQIEQQAMYSVMEQNRDAYCLITALCAFVFLQPGMSMPPGDPFNLDMMPGINLIASNVLLEEALRVRRGYEYLDNISLYTIATSYFIFACQDGIESHNRAWFYLREATTMTHMLGMDQDETYLQWDPVESSRRRRLYWLLFATERAYAIKRGKPVTLQATISLPTVNDDTSDPLVSQLGDFISTVAAFSTLDNAALAAWAKTRSRLSSGFLSTLQKQLNDVIPNYACHDSQLGDMSMNQEWLKSTAWQLSGGRLNGDDPALQSFQFPPEMARELEMTLASHFPNQSIEIGSGLMGKLVEVATATINVLSHKPASRDPFSLGPRERLNQIMDVLTVVRNGDYRFLPLLLSKVGDALPQLTNPMLQHAPENTNLANIDIFDGFGNAGMAQPPPMHMGMETDYDRKFSVAEYEKQFKTEPGVHNSSPGSGPPALTPVSSNETQSPFATSSPAILSPGVEFPHHVNDFGSFADMGMNAAHAATMNPQQAQQLSLPPRCLGSQQLPVPMSHSTTPHPMGPNPILASMARPPPSRANSYIQQQPPIPRTIGDFQSLQRAASDMANASSMDMDFAALR